jgi:lipopolysaccharide/colanic/teichoic acid biosynthesis glycosyltransferase
MTVVRGSETVKRITDVSVSGVLLTVLSVPLAAIWTLIRIRDGAPAVYRQARIGRHGRRFTIYKFRTMSVRSGTLDKDDSARLTSLGRHLRSSSLDELPELWNVLRGDMSLVGPRPLLPQYLSRYTPRQARRHEVRPGITGWAQVNGRNALSWEEKFELDVWYVDNWSLTLDFKILWLTLVQVLKREGISAEGHATMPEFLGTEEG